MATALRLRRGTTTQHGSFTGLEGEVTVDTTKDTVVVHDGSTAGGFPLAKETGSTVAVANGTVSAPGLTTSGDTNTGIFFPAADTIAFAEGGAEAMRIDSSGNVGIGTTTPNYTSAGSATSVLGVSARSSSGLGLLNINGTRTSSGQIVGNVNFFNNGGATPLASVYGIRDASDTTGSLALGTNDTERMRIDSSGNVGIGTSSPVAAVQLQRGASTAAYYAVASNNAALGTSGLLLGQDATGLSRIYQYGANAITLWTNDTERMRIDSSGNVGIGATPGGNRLNVVGGTFQVQQGTADSANFSVITSATPSSGVTLRTSWSGSGSQGPLIFDFGGSERARINSNGNLLVGTSTAGAGVGYETRLAVDGGSTYDPCMIKWSGTATSAYVLRLWNTATSGDNLFAVFQTEGTPTDRGNIRYNRGSGVVAYNTSSDANLKNIIGDSDGQRSLEILSTTRIREFAWKDDPNQHKQIGVIAQELYETYPGAVTVGGDFEREREVTEEVEEKYTDEEGNTQTRTVTKVVGTEKVTQYRPWSVDKTAFQLHLVAGWQAHEKLLKEAMTRIETLEAEVAAMKAN